MFLYKIAYLEISDFSSSVFKTVLQKLYCIIKKYFFNLFSDEDTYHLKNSLYTACKIGDVNSLTDLLTFFHSLDPKSDELHHNQYPYTLQDDADQTEGFRNGDTADCQNADKVLSSTASLSQENNIAGGEPVCGEVLERTKKSSCDQNASKPETKDNVKCDSMMSEGASHSQDYLDFSNRRVSTSLLNESVAEKEGTLLHIASRSGHRKVVSLLMENGADPTIRFVFDLL